MNAVTEIKADAQTCPPRASHSQQLAQHHRAEYRRALENGKAARTPLALETAQGWMNHHAKLVKILEGWS